MASKKIFKIEEWIHWKSLLSVGLAFWGLLCCSDLLGESTWRRCSHSIEEFINSIEMEQKRDEPEPQNQRMTLPMLLWNICAFMCSLIFCSIVKSLSWGIYKIFKIYNVFRNRKALVAKVASVKSTQEDTKVAASEGNTNCEVIFQNQQFSPEVKIISDELEVMKKEKEELTQQLVVAQKENLTSRQQIEEYKLETFMIKEKLARTANTLKENMKYKEFASANQEMIVRKVHDLENHLKEVSRDRDILRSKLTSMEKSYTKLEIRMKELQQDSESLENYPEKDTQEDMEPSNEFSPSDLPEIDLDKYQKKIICLQHNPNYEPEKLEFQANSKISVDLDESSLDTSKENDTENEKKLCVKSEINTVKQNLLNYNAYKAEMLRPKFKLTALKEISYSPPDTTGSSSDENSGPHRMISSTVEFQNFLKTLGSNSGGVSFRSNLF